MLFQLFAVQLLFLQNYINAVLSVHLSVCHFCQLACNCGLISLLSIFDKLLEKIMKSRLYSYLESNNILFDYQFGFRHNHSTTLALIDVVDKLYENLDKHNKVIGIYLDLQKAFDTVNHDILLHKLHNYGIRGVALDWFRNYLTGRYQYTTVNGVNSELTAVTCGVPQGSALGSVLFLVYVSDIKNAVPGDQIKLIADDTNLFVSGCTIGDTNFYSNVKLNKLCDWLIANKLM